MDGVEAWERAGILFETWRYGPGTRSSLEVHAHEHYQWCLSVDADGCYWYRGSRHAVPATAISVIHPQEPHASSDPADRARDSTYLVAYLPVEVVEGVLGEAPFFDEVVSVDPSLRALFRALHHHGAAETQRLALDDAIHGLLRHAFPRAAASIDAVDGRPGRARRAVAAAVEYVHERAPVGVSHADLAAFAGLSPRHLFREFKAATGLSPHRYQLQLRVDRAKLGLAAGGAPADVALACGFVDQSHLSRHFKRFVGFGPGRYRPRPQPNASPGTQQRAGGPDRSPMPVSAKPTAGVGSADTSDLYRPAV